jgi:hypothetical protein
VKLHGAVAGVRAEGQVRVLPVHAQTPQHGVVLVWRIHCADPQDLEAGLDLDRRGENLVALRLRLPRSAHPARSPLPAYQHPVVTLGQGPVRQRTGLDVKRIVDGALRHCDLKRRLRLEAAQVRGFEGFPEVAST